jgi:hypothetical protein
MYFMSQSNFVHKVSSILGLLWLADGSLQHYEYATDFIDKADGTTLNMSFVRRSKSVFDTGDYF